MSEQRISNRAAAEAVALAKPTRAEWDLGRGRVCPKANYIAHMRRAGWPLETVEVELPKEGHTNTGGPGVVRQPVVVVPEAWLREFARLTELSWSEVCRFVLPDDPRGRGRPAKLSAGGRLPPDTKQYNVRVTDEERAAIDALLKKMRSAPERETQ